MHTYVIGDIHGCLDQLQKLIQVLRTEGLGPADTLVFVGDYIDRGPHSKEVIDLLLQLKQEFDCTFLMGNHEEMFLNWLGIMDVTGMRNGNHFVRNGGDATLRSYGFTINLPGNKKPLWANFPDEHIEFLKNLDYACIVGNTIIVHAGLSFSAYRETTPDAAIERSLVEDNLWVRDTWRWPNNFGGTVVYGHTPYKTGVQWNHRGEGQPPYSVGIDTGCIFNLNPLVALRLEDWKVFSAGW